MRILVLIVLLATITPVHAQTIYVVETTADGSKVVREFGGMPLATVQKLMAPSGNSYQVVDEAAYNAAVAALKLNQHVSP